MTAAVVVVVVVVAVVAAAAAAVAVAVCFWTKSKNLDVTDALDLISMNTDILAQVNLVCCVHYCYQIQWLLVNYLKKLLHY